MSGQVTLALQSDKTTSEYASLAVAAEAYGFDGVSVFNDLGYQPALFPLLVMAAHTERIRLGPACLNPFLSHPVEIAGQVAALDIASQGRAYLGLARGTWLDRVGVAQERPLRTLREAVEVVALLLRAQGKEYTGEVFSIAEGTGLQYRPLRDRVGVLLGVWGPRGAALAAECADEVKLGGCANPDMVRLMRGWLAKECARVGRPEDAVGVVAGAVTMVDEDRVAARRHARTEVAMYVDVVAELDRTVDVDPRLAADLRELVAVRAYEEAGRLIPDDLLDRFCFAGTPADVAARAAELFEAGASRIEFGTPHGATDRHGVDLLGSQVLPELRR
ncbi:LLM class flavin-dependent oxidoreductase [Actinocrispum wychmicini]|uniref:5,10-methylenetetrahydromethanopterin reductase n=1 Tax=Actinocrispum wychmicini TaxID=1213861 RepID=A0A4R2IR54_9PSEU|nr:LLM class flavin-dependent oxidoreductase [Actinocrispum wychmicini]TCO45265.1 5,10-methylenetetrahydromethanopterin reductase [Actinocrispum wychmicini]